MDKEAEFPPHRKMHTWIDFPSCEVGPWPSDRSIIPNDPESLALFGKIRVWICEISIKLRVMNLCVSQKRRLSDRERLSSLHATLHFWSEKNRIFGKIASSDSSPLLAFVAEMFLKCEITAEKMRNHCRKNVKRFSDFAKFLYFEESGEQWKGGVFWRFFWKWNFAFESIVRGSWLELNFTVPLSLHFTFHIAAISWFSKLSKLCSLSASTH